MQVPSYSLVQLSLTGSYSSGARLRQESESLTLSPREEGTDENVVRFGKLVRFRT